MYRESGGVGESSVTLLRYQIDKKLFETALLVLVIPLHLTDHCLVLVQQLLVMVEKLTAHLIEALLLESEV